MGTKDKQYSFEEVQKHKGDGSFWIIIYDKVYDVTKWLDIHPGGAEILMENSGTDATEPWDDVGHSTDARNKMKHYLIGELRQEDRRGTVDIGPTKWAPTDSPQVNSESSWTSWIVPFGILLFAYYYLSYYYFA